MVRVGTGQRIGHVYINYNRVFSGHRLVEIIGDPRNRIDLSLANGGGNHNTCIYGGPRYLGGTEGEGSVRHTFSVGVRSTICSGVRRRVTGTGKWGSFGTQPYGTHQRTFSKTYNHGQLGSLRGDGTYTYIHQGLTKRGGECEVRHWWVLTPRTHNDYKCQY